MQFTGTLPRALVHRAAVAEVFLTDAERQGSDEVLLAAQLPRLHPFYDDTLGPRSHHAPFLLLEACRQGLFVVSHRYLGVPMDHKFLLRTVEFQVTDPAALAHGDSPAEVVIGAHIEHRPSSRSGLTGRRLCFTAAVGGREALQAGIDYSWMPPEDWQRLRSGQRDALGLPGRPVALSVPRIDPALVDRRDPANAVISPSRATGDGGRTARLVVDTTHPTLFDHWVDHVPGMLELEGLWQLALVASVDAGTVDGPAALPVALSARFRRFAEMDLPLECRTAPVRPGADVECTLHQPGALVAEARIRLADRNSTGPGGVFASPEHALAPTPVSEGRARRAESSPRPAPAHV
ncbi:ScbA/BarX family gamma-butyrolactone biosynthesis protein [Streptomyces djakartensis]|uniref:Adhesin n=1 Tax=Streptomyces djakartensis TaxID=68193 RepID=A0ABQ2Z4P1_9ACTN|nr:ScbA/BarX family gamma-butyrolactone biosynthesis protein [Streptomyces djakartensis]GGY01361.1 adhesin [Streptomyces djakartensis]